MDLGFVEGRERKFGHRGLGSPRRNAGFRLSFRGAMRVIVLLHLLLLPVASPAQRVWVAVDERGGHLALHTVQDSTAQGVHTLLYALGRNGWLFASPLAVETQRDTAYVTFSLGPRVRVSGIEVQGDIDGVFARELAPLRDAPYEASALEQHIARHLAVMSERGFGYARVEVVSFDVQPDSSLALTLLLERGPRFVQGSILPQGNVRMTAATLQRLARWREGEPWRVGSEGEIQARLQRSGLFQRVGEPLLSFTPEGRVEVEIPLQERSPGAFDLVLGLQPSPDGAAQWVGSGFIQLMNALGTGERASFRFERLPGTVSRVEATADWPRVPVVPLGLRARFTGVQQDSLFARQSAGFEVFVEFDRLEWGLTVTSERIRPGLAGARITSDGQRVARSDAVFRGVRARWAFGSLATQALPQEGADLYLAQGRRERVRQTLSGVERSRETQYRVEGKVSALKPIGARWDVRVGAQGWMLRGGTVEASELYRLGGASTFRGFEEDAFMASDAVRTFVEPGFHLDQDARAFVFGEMGRVREPLAARRVRATFAYGVGTSLALGTGGLVVTYALTPAEPLRAGKVHLVLSLGF